MGRKTRKPAKNAADNDEQISDLEVLLEIGGMGAGHASTALSAVLQEKVDVEVPRLHVKPPHLFPAVYEKHESAVVAVFMQLRSDADCDIMLIFEAEEAKKISALMTGGVEVDPEMERSAIQELGSIMIGSFLNAMADFTDTELVPTPPQLILDGFDAVIDELLVKQALHSDVTAIFDARFKRSGSCAEGYLILFPGEKLRTLIADRGRKWLSSNFRKGHTDQFISSVAQQPTQVYQPRFA